MFAAGDILKCPGQRPQEALPCIGWGMRSVVWVTVEKGPSVQMQTSR